MKEKKLRIEDALSATKAAVEEGIVAGGGTALVNVAPKVAKLVETLEKTITLTEETKEELEKELKK